MHTRARWGGRRAGAGRPARGPRPSERHQTRPQLFSAHALHVIARVDAPIARTLQRLGAAAAPTTLARAIELSRARVDFRIVHLGIRVGSRGAQLELIVEARDKLALARGMQGFQVSAARSLNRVARRTGRVFADRYHARALSSAPAVQRAVARLPPHARQLGLPASP